MLREWEGQFVEAVGEAVRADELPGGTDVGQLVFEVTAMLARANFAWVLTGDARVLHQARVGIEHVLDHASRSGRRRESRSRR